MEVGCGWNAKYRQGPDWGIGLDGCYGSQCHGESLCIVTLRRRKKKWKRKQDWGWEREGVYDSQTTCIKQTAKGTEGKSLFPLYEQGFTGTSLRLSLCSKTLTSVNQRLVPIKWRNPHQQTLETDQVCVKVDKLNV